MQVLSPRPSLVRVLTCVARGVVFGSVSEKFACAVAMISGVGLRFDVPSVDRAPEVYDDRVFELDDQYQMLAQKLGEDDLVREQSIQQLREWIAKHPRIRYCRTDAPFLLRFLRNNKYSFMKAAKMLECYVTALTVNKRWLTKLDIEADPDLEHLIDFGYIFPLPQRDAKGRIVLFSSSGGFYANPHKPSMHAVVKLNHMVTEIYLDTNEAQCAGFVFVYDMELSDINVLTSWLSIMEIKQLVQLTNNASAVRIQELHFINTPKTLRSIANMVLQLMSEKIRSRVFCHRSLESLYEVVDKTMLPKEFGGTIPMVEMSTGFKKLCQRMRPRLSALDEMQIELSDKDKEDDAWRVSEGGSSSGVVGSFRKLEVD